MKNRYISGKIFLTTLMLVLFFQSNAQDLVILHTNDTHSNIEPATSGRNAGMGGFQRRANYIAKMRSEFPNILLLDAGDYNQGTPYFTLFKGAAEIELYNAMGYDAVCLGNHEFDNGQKQLADRLKKANYPTVCANYDFSGTPLRKMVEPYVIINKKGLKIGIIGVLIDLKGYVSENTRKNLVYQNPIGVVNNLAKMLREKKECDVVIVLSHLGYDGGTIERPSDIELAKNITNVDMIIGGHSHTFLEAPVVVKNFEGNGVIVNQTGAAG
ncbi:MAG: bifunctional metallophosphatase/5'-nucleotidase, partial [Bacteroidales bacterium]|nr:bifunctional metallophosphatase/5'-nucleotidase [Bacteroidales bacterium]